MQSVFVERRRILAHIGLTGKGEVRAGRTEDAGCKANEFLTQRKRSGSDRSVQGLWRKVGGKNGKKLSDSGKQGRKVVGMANQGGVSPFYTRSGGSVGLKKNFISN